MNGELAEAYIDFFAKNLVEAPDSLFLRPGPPKNIHDLYINSARWEIDSKNGIMSRSDTLAIEFEKQVGHKDVYRLELPELYRVITTILGGEAGGKLRNELELQDYNKLHQFQDWSQLNTFERAQDVRTALQGIAAIREAIGAN